METRIDEVADDIFRVSTVIPDSPVVFNQYLVRVEQSLLFHTGYRATFPNVRDAINKVLPVESLRWITFGHVEADESGSMNEFLAVAPNATIAHTALGVMVQVADLADRPPHGLENGEVLDLGGKRVRNIDTPHLPHGWDAHVMYEETTGTLLSGDLFTQFGNNWGVETSDDLVESALAGEAFGGPTTLTATTGPTIRSLADLEPQRIALMHGPVFTGDAAKALTGLAEGYEAMFAATIN